jgi:hypothetical protein
MPLDAASAYYESMSPSLLASLPAVAKESDALPGKDWGTIFTHLESRLGALRSWRWSWWSYWAALAEYILPKRYKYLVVSNTMNRGLDLNTNIVDGTATLAMQICAAGLWSGLTSPSRPWFELNVGLPWVQLDEEGSAWLHDTQERLYVVLGQSNFYTIMAQAFQDVATFGTAPVIMVEDFEDIIRCYLPCSGEYYLGVGSRLSVDTLYREFNLTILGIVEMFGLDNCPSEVRAMWAQGGGSLENEMTVCQAIEPNFALSDRSGAKSIRVVPGSFPFREVYWLKGRKTERELSRRGFHERPFFAARWSVTSNDAYGRSPGMDCLGDAKQLQLETRRKAEFIEKLVRPPMGANVEMKNQPASILPGQVTYTSTEGGKKGFWPLYEVQPSALPPMIEDLKEIQERIRKAFFVDTFKAITNMAGVEPRNEMELTQRILEGLQETGPFIELFETEFADPAIMRVIAIMQRRNLLKPKPQSLRNVPIKITYNSMLRQAQISAETATMEKTFAIAGSMSEAAKAAGRPDPARVLNLDKALRVYGEKVGFEADLFFTPEQVAENDAATAKQSAQQQAMAATLPAVQAAQGLSKTPIGGGQTALGAMLGTQGGQ